MYTIEMYQDERTFTIGVFVEEAHAKAFLASVPFITKESYQIEDSTFEDYTLAIEQVPTYYEAVYNNHVYVFTRFMFTNAEGEASLFINPITNFSEPATAPSFAEAGVRVDAYSVAPEEAKDYIAAREAIFDAVVAHFAGKGLKVERFGLGSQDGEYAYCKDHLFLHLDAGTVDAWQQASSVEQFIKDMTE